MNNSSSSRRLRAGSGGATARTSPASTPLAPSQHERPLPPVAALGHAVWLLQLSARRALDPAPALLAARPPALCQELWAGTARVLLSLPASVTALVAGRQLREAVTDDAQLLRGFGPWLPVTLLPGDLKRLKKVIPAKSGLYEWGARLPVDLYPAAAVQQSGAAMTLPPSSSRGPLQRQLGPVVCFYLGKAGTHLLLPFAAGACMTCLPRSRPWTCSCALVSWPEHSCADCCPEQNRPTGS